VPGPALGLFAPLPEDLRAPWTWVDLLVFVFFGLGAMIVLSQVALIVLAVFFHISPAAIEQAPTARAAFATLHQWLWSLAVMLYLFLMVRVRFGTPFWRTLGWRDLRLKEGGRVQGYLVCLLGGSVLAFVIQLASAFVGTKATLPIEALFRSRGAVLLVMATGILVAPLVEETIFRGYLYPVLARSLGIGGGVVLTGTLFGLMHAMQLWGGWGQIGLLIMVGIVFTYVRARTGTVLAPYLLHLGYNLLLFAGFYFATGRLRHLPGAN
jgi:membrane protease YdiL (CAAX protease family)